ncbi:Na+/H+ antiporter NhaC family protein [[Clostridium] symbiosum]|uniref:YfcC family protein n=1 Tax=Clostridium symbiosum TaxID=1512 RepID=UPI001D07FCC7|nr:Na+/H+ antiporter NhaC family protein [[Clostridium] symbiosum]MCB6611387.1 TIGR00366 family protein [[Clostridium] symbiosum]MCB6932276.1 TIGR00366 family protein [[Clostridium] symbiosum]
MKEKKAMRIPHPYIIIFFIIVVSAVLTWILPSGAFKREMDEALGRALVIPGSYARIPANPVGPWRLLECIYEGFVASADISFFLLFACGYVGILMKSGTLNALVGAILRKMKDKDYLLIPIFTCLFAVGGATFGMHEEAWGFIPLFVAIALSLGYDRVVGAGIVELGTVTGCAGAIFNPFNVGIASGIAGVPITTPMLTVFRCVTLVVFTACTTLYLMHYAEKIKKDPKKSVLYGVKEDAVSMSREEMVALPFSGRQKVTLALFGILIAALAVGVTKYGFYLTELAALFLGFMIITGFANRMDLTELAEAFIESSKGMIFAVLMIGFARSIEVILTQGGIIDTVVLWMANLVQSLPRGLSAFGMLAVQNIVNMFIPSGTGQAVVMIPIMAPLADLVGLSRYIAIMAFQFGDAFSNVFWPTAVAITCGVMGIGMDRWLKFVAKLFGMMFVLQAVMLTIAVAIGI